MSSAGSIPPRRRLPADAGQSSALFGPRRTARHRPPADGGAMVRAAGMRHGEGTLGRGVAHPRLWRSASTHTNPRCGGLPASQAVRSALRRAPPLPHHRLRLHTSASLQPFFLPGAQLPMTARSWGDRTPRWRIRLPVDPDHSPPQADGYGIAVSALRRKG